MMRWRKNLDGKAREEHVRYSAFQDLDRGGSYGIKHNCILQ